MTKSAKAKRSFSRFLSVELLITGISAVLSYFGAQYIYNLIPGFFIAIGNIIPTWLPLFGSVTGYTIAFVTVAAVIWLGSNSFLFALNLRKY